MKKISLLITRASSVLTSEKVLKIFRWLLIAGLIFFIPWLLVYAGNVIVTQGPVGYREGADILLTDYLLHGKNPFFLQNQPLMNTNKGAFYNLVMLPFVAVFGNTLAIHRTLSIFFIVLSCALIVWSLIRFKTSLPYAIAGGTIVFAGLLFYTGPISRADGLGTFLYLAAGVIPFIRKFDRTSLTISALAGILAFFTKPYFILSVGVVALYLFLFKSKKKGFVFGAITMLFLLVICMAVRKFFPLYFLNTILNNASNGAEHVDFLINQLIRFSEIFAPVILIFLLTNPIRLNQPFAQIPYDYFGFFFLCATAAILVLGQNSGNYMVYLFQLMTPPLVILAFKNLDCMHKWSAITVPLIILNLVLLCFGMLYPNTPPSGDQWKEVNQLLSISKKVLNSPVLVPEMVRLGMQPIDSGSSEYYYRTEPYSGNLFAPFYSITKMRGDDYLYEIETTIKEKGFDRIIITSGYSSLAKLDLIRQYYVHIKDFHISMPQSNENWDLEYWEPIK
jgi:hypothetical protein